MAGYIYLPVVTGEMQDFAQQWNDGRLRKGKPAYTILHNSQQTHAGPALKQVEESDKLYILAHGDQAGHTLLGAKLGEEWKRYTADELAKLLRDEGLRTGFVDLRIFACGSSVRPRINQVDAPSFAASLKATMQSLGYQSLRVTGYQGMTYTDYGKMKFDPDTFPAQVLEGLLSKTVKTPSELPVRAKLRKDKF